MIAIYGLIDPETSHIRYIGKSERPESRLSDHCHDRQRCHRTNWIQSLAKRGLRPSMTILEMMPDGSGWEVAERRWIAFGRFQNWPLTNSTDGGDGVSNISGEGKERMLRTWKGRKHSPESLLRIGAASRGRRHKQEYKDFMRRTMRVRVFTDQHRQRLSVAQRKLTATQEMEIAWRLWHGELGKDLAEEFGVHRTTLSKVKMKYPLPTK